MGALTSRSAKDEEARVSASTRNDGMVVAMAWFDTAALQSAAPLPPLPPMVMQFVNTHSGAEAVATAAGSGPQKVHVSSLMPNWHQRCILVANDMSLDDVGDLAKHCSVIRSLRVIFMASSTTQLCHATSCHTQKVAKPRSDHYSTLKPHLAKVSAAKLVLGWDVKEADLCAWVSLLPSLQQLRISGAVIPHVDGLLRHVAAASTGLTTLSLVSCAVTSLNDLIAVPTLRSLTVQSGLITADGIRALSLCMQLDELRLIDCASLRDVSALSHSPSLTSLQLFDMAHVVSPSSLADVCDKVPRLRRLETDVVSQLVIEALARRPAVVALLHVTTRFGSWQATSLITKVAPLLEELHVTVPIDMDWSLCTHLSTLHLGEYYAGGGYRAALLSVPASAIAKMPSLTNLTINALNSAVTITGSLCACQSLSTLHTGHAEHLEGMNAVPTLTNVTFAPAEATSRAACRALMECSRLRSLTLAGPHIGVELCAAVAFMPQLETLNCESCVKVNVGLVVKLLLRSAPPSLERVVLPYRTDVDLRETEHIDVMLARRHLHRSWYLRDC